MESCCKGWERLKVWPWTHIPIWVGGGYKYTGGGILREESRIHSDPNQQTVDPAVDDSGDEENEDQAEGGVF